MTALVPHTGTATAVVLNEEERAVLSGLLRDARSENTNKAYLGQIRKFSAWLESTGRKATLPIAPEVVALYIDKLVKDGVRWSSLTQAVSALDALMNDRGFDSALFKSHIVSSALTAGRRKMAADGRSRIKKAPPFTLDELERLSADAPATAKGRRDIAMLLLGVSTALRGSNIVSLYPGDLTFDEVGLTVNVSHSKTDQYGAGGLIYIERLSPSNRALDAVAALEEWMEARRELWRDYRFHPEDSDRVPVFLSMRKGDALHLDFEESPHGMTRESFDGILKEMCEASGIEKTVSTHSLRHSFVSLGFEAGADSSTIAKTTGHKSLTTLAGYDQRTLRMTAITRKVFDK